MPKKIAVVMAAGVSGCDATNIRLNGEEGKPLSELDLSGTAPTELVLLGPDEVRVTTGDKLAITVEGDDALKDQMRFTLKDGALGILRKDKAFSGSDKPAIVNVTMPAPSELVMAGSKFPKVSISFPKITTPLSHVSQDPTNAPPCPVASGPVM